MKWIETRSENFLTAYQGRGMSAEVELAFDADGHMLALRAHIEADIGAYLFANSAMPPHTAAMLMCGAYAIPAASVTSIGTRSDRVPTGPCRGAGRPEAAAFLEWTVDQAERELGMELRRRNLIRAFPHQTPLGFSYDSGDYERCLDLALELVEPERGPLVGTGVALYVERAGGQFEEARVELLDATGAWWPTAPPARTARATRRRSRRSSPTRSASSRTGSSCASTSPRARARSADAGR